MADDDATARRPIRATKAGPVKKAAVTKAAPARKGAPVKAAPAKAAAGSGSPVRQSPVKKSAAGASPVKKSAAGGSPVKKTAVKKAPAKKTAATKAPAGKAPPRDRGATLASREKAPPPLRLAAEQTFDDDWQPPAPEPAREDPAARVRGILRAAALSLEARDAGPARTAAFPRPAPPTPPPPVAPPPPDEPVTRVLVAPAPPDPDLEDDDQEEEATLAGDEWTADEEDGEDWSPPEVLDDTDSRPEVVRAPAPRRVAAPPPPPTPAPPPTPPPPPRPPVTESADEIMARPPAGPPAGKPAGRGPWLSILAIVLAVFGPVLGAVIAFFLAGRARRRGAALAGLARVVAVLALVGWLVTLGVLGFVRLRDDGVDYSKLKVGDCFASSESNEVRGVKVEPCSKPHNSEIFFLVTHPAGPADPYPGKDALVQFAADACLGQPLTDYLGAPMEASKLKDFEIVPQQSAWKDGRRVLVCGLDTAGQGDITGSVKGTRR